MEPEGTARTDHLSILSRLRTGQKLAAVLTLVALTAIPSPAQSLQYPTNFQFVPVPDPLSGTNPTYPLTTESLPAIGVPFFDHYFGTVKTRATFTDGYNSRHEYSRFDPFNRDQSIILLIATGGAWKAYRTQTMPYNTTASLIREVLLAEPRWDLTSPTLIWGLDQFSIMALDVETGVQTVIKNFATDATMGPIISTNTAVWRITTREEGEPSLDKRYWAFMLQGNDLAEYKALYIFTWDRQLDQVLGVRALTGIDRDVDYVGMSPLGNWVLAGADHADTGTFIGTVMADKTLTQVHSLGYAIGHQDVGLDVDGREVLVGQNARTDYIDLIPLDLATSAVSSPSQYPGSNITPLIRLFCANWSPYNLNSGVHVSCNHRGYAVVSTYIAPGLPDSNWLDRTIVLARVDRNRPGVYYLAKIHNTTNENPRAYWEETHATITNDGSKVVWADNWGLNVGQEQLFLMQLDMPPNWHSLDRSAAAHWPLYP